MQDHTLLDILETIDKRLTSLENQKISKEKGVYKTLIGITKEGKEVPVVISQIPFLKRLQMSFYLLEQIGWFLLGKESQ